jgi:hypothetical protein
MLHQQPRDFVEALVGSDAEYVAPFAAEQILQRHGESFAKKVAMARWRRDESMLAASLRVMTRSLLHAEWHVPRSQLTCVTATRQKKFYD